MCSDSVLLHACACVRTATCMYLCPCSYMHAFVSMLLHDIKLQLEKDSRIVHDEIGLKGVRNFIKMSSSMRRGVCMCTTSWHARMHGCVSLLA